MAFTVSAPAVLVSCLLLELAGGKDLYWQPNSNWGSPANWALGRVPACNHRVSFASVSEPLATKVVYQLVWMPLTPKRNWYQDWRSLRCSLCSGVANQMNGIIDFRFLTKPWSTWIQTLLFRVSPFPKMVASSSPPQSPYACLPTRTAQVGFNTDE